MRKIHASIQIRQVIHLHSPFALSYDCYYLYARRWKQGVYLYTTRDGDIVAIVSTLNNEPGITMVAPYLC